MANGFKYMRKRFFLIGGSLTVLDFLFTSLLSHTSCTPGNARLLSIAMTGNIGWLLYGYYCFKRLTVESWVSFWKINFMSTVSNFSVYSIAYSLCNAVAPSFVASTLLSAALSYVLLKRSCYKHCDAQR